MPSVQPLLNSKNELEWPPLSVGKFGSHLSGLQVTKWDGEAEAPTPLACDQQDFLVTALIAHFGLRLLETTQGQRALGQVGLTICKANVKSGAYDEEMSQQFQSNMAVLVKLYLSALRDSMVPLVIIPANYHPNAGYARGIGGNHSDRGDHKGMRVELNEFTIALHEVYVMALRDFFIKDKNQRGNLSVLIVWYSMIFSHELAHGFRAYLNEIHGQRVATPPQCYPSPTGSVPNYSLSPDAVVSTMRRGEAGDAFEHLAFGGAAEIFFVLSEEAKHDLDIPVINAFRAGLQVSSDSEGRLKHNLMSRDTATAFLNNPPGADFDLNRFRKDADEMIDVPFTPDWQREVRDQVGMHSESDEVSYARFAAMVALARGKTFKEAPRYTITDMTQLLEFDKATNDIIPRQLSPDQILREEK